MSKDRLTRKEMQRDELKEALVDARDYVSSHRQQSLRYGIAGGAVLLAAAAIWGGLTLHEKRLGARLSHALSLFEAPLVTDGTGVAPGQKVFKDAAQRQTEVTRELSALAKDSPGSTAGRAAAVVLLGLQGPASATGTRVDAVKAFAEGAGGSISSGLAAVALLDAQAASGHAKEAIASAKHYLDQTEPPVPKDILVFTLAKLYEKSGQPAEAKTFYQRVVSDFPESPFRYDAQQKLTSL